jgi:hypothetical protein
VIPGINSDGIKKNILILLMSQIIEGNSSLILKEIKT